MATLALTIPTPELAPAGAHPAAFLIGEDGTRYRFRFAPTIVDHVPDRVTWWQEERPGRKPLTGPAGASLRTASFEFLVAALDHQVDVELDVEKLEAMARSSARVRLALGPSEAGWWANFDNLTWRSVLRQHGTNRVTRAEAQIDLVEAAAGHSNAGPVGGGVDWTGRLGTYRKRFSGRNDPRHYTVRAGDTLAKISTRYYGTTRQWRVIADANGITNPARQVTPGRRLRIP